MLIWLKVFPKTTTRLFGLHLLGVGQYLKVKWIIAVSYCNCEVHSGHRVALSEIFEKQNGHSLVIGATGV